MHVTTYNKQVGDLCKPNSILDKWMHEPWPRPLQYHDVIWPAYPIFLCWSSNPPVKNNKSELYITGRKVKSSIKHFCCFIYRLAVLPYSLQFILFFRIPQFVDITLNLLSSDLEQHGFA